MHLLEVLFSSFVTLNRSGKSSDLLLCRQLNLEGHAFFKARALVKDKRWVKATKKVSTLLKFERDLMGSQVQTEVVLWFLPANLLLLLQILS